MSRRGRPPKLEYYGKVIQILREGPKTWSELQKQTNIPERTLTNILNTLNDWGLARKLDDGRWALYTYERVYRSFEEWKQAILHSEKLISAINTLIFELRGGFVLLDKNAINMKKPKLYHEIIETLETPSRTDYEIVKLFLQHLKSGYPEIFKSFVEVMAMQGGVSMLKLDEGKVELFDEPTPTLGLLNKIRQTLFNYLMDALPDSIDYKHKRKVDKRLRPLLKRDWDVAKDFFIIPGRLSNLQKSDFCSDLLRYAINYVRYKPKTDNISVSQKIQGESLTMSKELAEIVKVVLNNRKFIDLLKRLVELEDVTIKKRNKVISQLLEIEGQVKAGKPLRGTCDACIRVKPLSHTS